jgi:hypothetical protein
MRLIVSGSRSIKDYKKVYIVLNEILAHLLTQGHHVHELVEGEAQGVDLLAKQWANESGIPVKPFPADWDNIEGVPAHRIRTNGRGHKYNIAAGYERNQRMVDYASPEDLFIAIWDGKSGGTDDCVEKAKKRGLQVLTFIVEAPNVDKITKLSLVQMEGSYPAFRGKIHSL